MDFTRNVDKVNDCLIGVQYNGVIDVNNNAAVATEPVTLQQVKDYAKIDLTTDDTILTAFITVARKQCEDYLNTNLVAREVIAIINNSNGGMYLPYSPTGTVTSVSDFEGNVISSDGYRITGEQFKQVQWPTYSWLKLTYTGGYSSCPEIFKTAIKAQIVFLNENRGEGGMSPVALSILNPFRRVC